MFKTNKECVDFLLNNNKTLKRYCERFNLIQENSNDYLEFRQNMDSEHFSFFLNTIVYLKVKKEIKEYIKENIYLMPTFPIGDNNNNFYDEFLFFFCDRNFEIDVFLKKKLNIYHMSYDELIEKFKNLNLELRPMSEWNHYEWRLNDFLGETSYESLTYPFDLDDLEEDEESLF
jgi:hypothetical protein